MTSEEQTPEVPRPQTLYTPGNLYGYQNKGFAKFDCCNLLKAKRFKKCGKFEAIRK